MKARTIFSFFMLVVLAIAGTSAISIWQARSALVERSRQSHAALARELHHTVSLMLSRGLEDARSLAAHPTIVAATSSEEVTRVLVEFKRQGHDYADATVVRTDGVVIGSSDYRFAGDWRAYGYFQSALAGRPTISPGYLLAGQPEHFVGFAAPVFDQDDQVSRVVVLQHALGRVADVVEHLTVGDSGGALLADAHGLVLAGRIHPRGDMLPRGIIEALAAGARADELLGRPTVAAMHPRITFPDDSPPRSWHVIVYEEEPAVRAAAAQVTSRILILTVVLLAVALLAAMRFARRVLAPLSHLEQGVHAAAQSNFTHEVAVGGPAEIRQLAQAFNRMMREIARGQAELVASEARYRDIAELLPQTIFEADATTGRLTYTNQAGFATFGLAPDDLARGINVFDLIAPEDRPRAMERARLLLLGRELNTGQRYRGRTARGELRTFIIYTASFTRPDGQPGLRGVLLDVTEQDRQERELQQAQKMESVGMLASGIAHDFNNVLSGVNGVASLLRLQLNELPATDPGRRSGLELLDLQDETVTRAAQMVRQLLTLVRRQHSEVGEIELNDCVEQAVRLVTGTFDKSIAVRARPWPQPARTRGDRARIEQVLLNLMVNGAHAMTTMRPTGQAWGGELEIGVERRPAPARLRTSDEKRSDAWVVTVTDTGIGIPQDQLTRIFDPFFTTKEQGTGLGLSMVFSIVGSHGGLVEVESELGQGTTFLVWLPIREPLDERGLEDARPAVAPRGEGTILLVDDEAIVRLTAGRLLDRAGFTVLVADSGAAALSLVSQHRDRLDAVVLDMSMPGMSGLELYLAIRVQLPNLPALIVSGVREDPRVDTALAAGVRGFVQKPWRPDELVAAVVQITSPTPPTPPPTPL